MNFKTVRYAMAKNGDFVTFRRVAGTKRVPFDVRCLGAIRQSVSPQSRSSRMELVGEIQQGFDLITVTNAEMVAARWPAPPRHGDQVLFDNGTVLTVQGRVQISQDPRGEGDAVYQCAVVG